MRSGAVATLAAVLANGPLRPRPAAEFWPPGCRSRERLSGAGGFQAERCCQTTSGRARASTAMVAAHAGPIGGQIISQSATSSASHRTRRGRASIDTSIIVGSPAKPTPVALVIASLRVHSRAKARRRSRTGSKVREASSWREQTVSARSRSTDVSISMSTPTRAPSQIAISIRPEAWLKLRSVVGGRSGNVGLTPRRLSIRTLSGGWPRRPDRQRRSAALAEMKAKRSLSRCSRPALSRSVGESWATSSGVKDVGRRSDHRSTCSGSEISAAVFAWANIVT